MKIAATLVPLLVAASATAASASPWSSSYSASGEASFSLSYGTSSTRDHRTTVRPTPARPAPSRAYDRDHRAAPTYPPFPARYDVRRFASPMWTLNPPRHEHEMYRWTNLGVVSTGKQTIKPPSDGRYDLLQVQVTGRVSMAEIGIEFTDRTTQIIQVRRVVDARNPLPVIDLTGSNRSILRIVVYTDQAPGGELTVLAR